MAMQMRGADPRLYNPDRDMIWAMPRLMKKALQRFGEDITVDEVRAFMRERGIETERSDEDIYHTIEKVITDFAKYLNDLKDAPEVRRAPAERYNAIFAPEPPDVLYQSLRAVIGDFFISIVYAELPFWFDSVQPEKANNPAPTVEEVSHVVQSLLSNRGAKSGADHE